MKQFRKALTKVASSVHDGSAASKMSEPSPFQPRSDSTRVLDILERVRVKVRASLDCEAEVAEVHNWLDRWKPAMSHCSRSGGVWDERYEVVLPRNAVEELPSELVREVSAETSS